MPSPKKKKSKRTLISKFVLDSSTQGDVSREKNTHDLKYDQNHVLIHDAYISLIKKLNRFPIQQEIADETGLSRNTVGSHMREFKFDPSKHASKIMTEDIVLSIAKASFKGNPMSQKLWLQYMEGWSEKTEQTINTDLPKIGKIQIEYIKPIESK